MKQNKIKEVIVMLPLYLWVMCVTIGGHLLGIESSWVFCIMVPVFFLMGGEMKQKVPTVVGGAVTGLVMSYLLCIAVTVLSAVVGQVAGWIIPVSVAIAILMLLRPFLPYVCNNVAFLYLIVATRDPETFYAEFGRLMLYFLVGGLIYLGGILLIIKGLQALGKKKAAQAAAEKAE